MRIKKTFQGSLPENTVVNTQSDSQTNAYSCEYINEHFGGTVLYSNSTGTTGTVTLSDTISNYKYIEIYCRWYTEYSIPVFKIDTTNITNGKIVLTWNNEKTIFTKRMNISGTSITKDHFCYYVANTGETSNWDACYIMKVIGYK